MVRPLSFMEVKKRASRHESTDTGWLNRGYSQGVLFTWGWAAAAELCSEKKKRKKLLKITNYPSLAAYRTIPEPQRMPAVLTLTETTHVTQSKSSSFFFNPSPPFSSHFHCSVWFGLCPYVCLLLHLSVRFYVCASSQRQTSVVLPSDLIDGRV